MNSAPVQFLPIESGSGYKQKPPDSEAPVDANGKFGDVFSRTVSEAESLPPDKKTVDDSSDKDNLKGDSKDAGAKLESGKITDESDVSAREDVSAEKSADSEVKHKRGLSVKNVKSRTDPDGSRNSEKRIKTVLKESGALKKLLSDNGRSSMEGGAAVVSDSLKLKGLLPSEALKPETESEPGNLSDKLKAAAELAERSGHKAAGAEKPEIRLIAVVPQESKKDAGKIDLKKKGDKNFAVKSDKRQSKFRIVDHRRTTSSITDKAAKSTVAEPSAAKTDSSSVFKDAVSGAQYESTKFDSAGSETKTMQSSVLSQLKDSVNNQIVKQAGIVVKGDGTGEIKLVMKPDSLGKVRIQLSLNDNHIAGRIIVENNIVREIFESNLENLYKAFGSEGFENGGLEVSVQGQGGNAENGGRRGGRSLNGRAVKVLENAVPEFVESEWRSNTVNMVV